MTTIIRHTAVWTGTAGLPGYSQFYQQVTGTAATQAQEGHDDVGVLFNGIVSLIPEEITVTVSPVYQLLDVATGELTGEGTVDTPAAAAEGEMVGGWNAQVGVLVEWITGAFVDGVRLRGRTYLVPLGELADVDGTLPNATLVTIRAWAAFIVSGAHGFVVWHRPKAGTGGLISAITGLVVRDKACILRSRMI